MMLKDYTICLGIYYTEGKDNPVTNSYLGGIEKLLKRGFFIKLLLTNKVRRNSSGQRQIRTLIT